MPRIPSINRCLAAATYNAQRPHQGLDDKWPVTPAERFKPEADRDRGLLDLWLPPTLVRTPKVTAATAMATAADDDDDDQAESVIGVGCACAVDGWAGRVRAGGATEREHDRHPAAT